MSTARQYPTGATDRQSTAAHTAADLTFSGVNVDESLIYYRAPSASRPGKVNEVALCALTGATLCDCRAAECGHHCWHRAVVAEAFAAHPAVRAVTGLPDATLLAYGKKCANFVRQYRAACGRALPFDAVALVAARFVWCCRRPEPAGEGAA